MEHIFHELIVKGSFERTKAFVTGFLAGKGVQGKRYFSRECGIRQEKLPEKIVEWVGLAKDRTHVILHQSVVLPVRSALKKHGPELGVEFIVDQRILRARFRFTYTVYNRKQANKIASLLQPLPRGLQMTDYRPREEVHPESKGPEMYAPSHDYTLAASGMVEGPVDKVIRFYERLDEHEHVRLRPIRLQLK